MRVTNQAHVTDNDMTFTVGRLWDTVENAPAYGNNTIIVKIGVPKISYDITFFIDGDDATLFKLQGQLRDLANQVEELISPDALIVAYENVGTGQDGEGM